MYLLEWLKLKSLTRPSIDKNIEILNSHTLLARNVKRHTHFGK